MEKTQNKDTKKRIALTINQSDYDLLAAYAEITEHLPAVAARDIVVKFLKARAEEISEAKKAADAYKELRRNLQDENQISLFSEECLAECEKR